MTFHFGVTRSPARVIFGPGQRRALGLTAKPFGTRALICTDARLGGGEVIAEMQADLESHGFEVEVFSGTEAELPLGGIESCVAQYRGFAPQVVVGVGGGSCLDMAKLVSLLLSYDQPIETFYGEFKVPGTVIPIIAVPTTSGTGSEVTPVAVLADPRQEMKIGISSPELIPVIAICDPELTLTCPPALTAVSGADALAHAIEAFAAVKREPTAEISMQRVFVGKNVLSDHYATSAIKLLFDWLPKAVEEANNLEARSWVMLASTLAGLAFGTAGTAAAHALQYPVGATTHSAHGLGVGVLLPYTMEYNLSNAMEDYAALSDAIGIAEKESAEADARHFIKSVRHLFWKIGIPSTLQEIGFAAEDVEWAAERAILARRLIENNPRLIDRTAAAEILRKAVQGV